MKRFKETHQHQLLLLPPNLDEMIEANHLVRIIDKFVSALPSKLWDARFCGGGAPSYHPAVMLKVILYAYSLKIFSCREIAKSIRQDITFMWLAGMQRPTFNTINRFRTDYFKDILEEVFTELLNFLAEKNLISFQDFFVDGTKIEANAGRYTYVWQKNTERYKAAVKERIKKLLHQIDKINQEEDELYGDSELPEFGEQTDITSEEIRELAQRLIEHLPKSCDKKGAQQLKTAVNRLNKESEKLSKYEKQEELLDGRNSYSKTDSDATFMRMKDDRLRPGYNAQFSTENQFITNYSISQNASDTVSFPEHLAKIIQRGAGYRPNNYMGDCAYGSEENYSLLEMYEIGNYLKYNTFHFEKKKKYKNDSFKKDNFFYDETADHFVCPAGNKLTFRETIQRESKTGYISNVRVYEFEGCNSCVYKSQCTKAKGNRQIYYNPELERHKKVARSNLDSRYGKALRKRRGFEVETFFGDLRQNCRLNRFLLRGRSKVEHEFGLLVIAYNLRKLAKEVLKKEVCQGVLSTIYRFFKNLVNRLHKRIFFDNNKALYAKKNNSFYPSLNTF